MPNNVDRRVVEMRFDNKDFESNVQTSMSTLEKLKEKLNFKGAGKDFDSAGLTSAVDKVRDRFSALEIVGMTALVNLTNSAVNLGKQLAKSLTIDQVKAGFSEYELKMGSIQTIMAGTGESLDKVNQKLNELNTYSDRTIYSFSDMTSNIGKFTNAGVKLDDAVAAIQGVSNVAAVSGANAQEASRAMYNFSQALSAGYVKLIDWKSIENANMATVEFKQQLIDTAVAMGNLEKNADGTYNVLTSGANGPYKEAMSATKNFNDSLSSAWMSTEVLTQTLSNYSADLENMSASEKEAWKNQLKSIGYTEDQIAGIEKLNAKAFAAAQDVKTFSMLMDTVKEAIGSSWAQTFEILFGNFEEAKALWTGINNVVSGLIDSTDKARNGLLQGWKDLGGRNNIINAFKNLFKGFSSVAAPLKEAFREVFPPATAEQLKLISVRIEHASESFSKLMSIMGRNLKSDFVDIFKAGADVIGIFKDALKGVFDVFTGGGGESAVFSGVQVFVKFIAILARGVSALISFARATGVFKLIHSILLGLNDVLFGVFESLGFYLDGLGNVASGIRDIFSSLAEVISNVFSGFDVGGLDIINKLGSAFGTLFYAIGKGLSKVDFSKLGGVLAGGGLLAGGLKLASFLDILTKKVEKAKNAPKLLDKVKETLGSLSDTLNTFQASIKIASLLTIAIALGVLAGACLVLSDIPIAKLVKSVTALGVLMLELTAASHLMKASETRGIIKMAAALLILAVAVKTLSEIENMNQGLQGVTVLLTELIAFFYAFDRLRIKPSGIAKTAFSMILFAAAIRMMVKPIRELGDLDVGQLVQGLLAVGAILLGFVGFSKLINRVKPKSMISASAALVIMGLGLSAMVAPIKSLGNLDSDQLVKGLGSVGVALLEVVAFAKLMSMASSSSAQMLATGASLVLMAVGVQIMAGAISTLSNIENVGEGLSSMFGALVILAGAMLIMQNAVAGAAAMVIVAGALMIMAPAIALLSSLSLSGVGVGLLALAGTLTVFGVAAMLLTPVVPLMLALGAAMALLGAGVLTLGAGMTLLAAAFATGVTPIVQGVIALSEALPDVLKNLAEALGVFMETLADEIPKVLPIIEELFKIFIQVATTYIPEIANIGIDLIMALLKAISENIGEMTVLALEIITNFINGLAEGLPDIIDAGFNLMISFFDGMANAISERGPELVNSMQNVLLSILEVFVGSIPFIGEAGAEAIAEYRSGLQGGTGQVKSTTANIKSTAENGLRLKDMSAEGRRGPQTLNSGMSSQRGSVRSTANSIASAANINVPSQYGTGQNVVQGLINGIYSRISALRSAASSLGSAINSNVQNSLGIRSPSRVMMENGRYIVLGLIKGIDSLTPEYERKADNIATTMISSISSAQDSMSSFGLSDMNLNSQISRSADVNLRMNSLQKENDRLAKGISQLTNTLGVMTDTMNSRSLNNYITVDGSTDPEAFADGLIRSFKLNARTV